MLICTSILISAVLLQMIGNTAHVLQVVGLAADSPGQLVGQHAAILRGSGSGYTPPGKACCSNSRPAHVQSTAISWPNAKTNASLRRMSRGRSRWGQSPGV